MQSAHAELLNQRGVSEKKRGCDEDGGKREVVWETVRFVCVAEAHHDGTEEEPHRDERERRGPYPSVCNEAPDEEHSERGDVEAAAGDPDP
jgi:hypothetical protein